MEDKIDLLLDELNPLVLERMKKFEFDDENPEETALRIEEELMNICEPLFKKYGLPVDHVVVEYLKDGVYNAEFRELDFGYFIGERMLTEYWEAEIESQEITDEGEEIRIRLFSDKHEPISFVVNGEDNANRVLGLLKLGIESEREMYYEQLFSEVFDEDEDEE